MIIVEGDKNCKHEMVEVEKEWYESVRIGDPPKGTAYRFCFAGKLAVCEMCGREEVVSGTITGPIIPGYSANIVYHSDKKK